MAERLPDPDPSQFPALGKSHQYVTRKQDRLVRIFNTGGRYPMKWNQHRHFGPIATGRFDHHPDGPAQDHDNHGVWYAAIEIDRDNRGIATAVAERFQETRTVPLDDHGFHLTICHPGRDLRLLDLRTGWITQAAGNAAIASGSRTQSRKWARAIREEYDTLDGLVWSSSVYPSGNAIVVWEDEDPAFAPTARLIRSLPDMTPYLVAAAKTLKYSIAG